jgi:hypothetical protein
LRGLSGKESDPYPDQLVITWQSAFEFSFCTYSSKEFSLSLSRHSTNRDSRRGRLSSSQCPVPGRGIPRDCAIPPIPLRVCNVLTHFPFTFPDSISLTLSRRPGLMRRDLTFRPIGHLRSQYDFILARFHPRVLRRTSVLLLQAD